LVVALDDASDIESLPALDAIADTINGATAAEVVRKLKRGGVFASVLAPPANATDRPDMVIKTMEVETDPTVLVEMARAVHAGKLAIPIARSFPLREAHAAHAAAETSSSGKILLLA
jgi:NADPH:quinone reductase-like Zn-dependent oxidoreductase